MLSTCIKFLSIFTISILMIACGSDSNSDSNIDGDYAKVYKPDGSLQCTEGSISLTEMRLELAKQGIDVICAQKANDGLVYLTVCGAETGNINVYLIHKVNLPDAEKLGFKSVTVLPDYQDKDCRN